MARAIAQARCWGRWSRGVAHEHGLREQRRHRRRHERQARHRPRAQRAYGELRDFEKTCTRSVRLVRGRGHARAAAGGRHPDARRIPEATVARLPLYYRALLETPSRRSARSRRSAWPSWPASTRPRSARTSRTSGSYGTRGVGYDVEYLLHEITRELGLTHDWPVAIVGSATSARRSPTTAASAPGASGSSRWSTPTRRRSASGSATSTIESHRRPPDRSSRERRHRDRRSSPRPARAAQEVADRLVDGGRHARSSTSRPTVVTVPDGRVAAQGRPRDRAADPVLLPTAPARPPAATRAALDAADARPRPVSAATR